MPGENKKEGTWGCEYWQDHPCLSCLCDFFQEVRGCSSWFILSFCTETVFWDLWVKCCL